MPSPPHQKQIDEVNLRHLRRWEDFRKSARFVAVRLSRLDEVVKIVLFGSLAVPLEKETPRYRSLRRHGTQVFHEVNDVDLAVWLKDLRALKLVRTTINKAVAALFQKEEIGVAHHQFDIFVMEPGTHRYLGRLCTYNDCPKGKPECRAPGCGEPPNLRQHENFHLAPDALTTEKSEILYDALNNNRSHLSAD